MRVCITTTNREVGDYVYDLLTNPLSGNGCLCGSKRCIDDHNVVPDIMEFDLEPHEIEELQKIEGVIRISPSGIGKPTLGTSRRTYKVRTPDVIYRNASYTYADNISTTARPRVSPSQSGLNLGPAYQYYATTHQPSATNLVPETNNRMTSAFSLDCREVDIIMLDTGVDPSCEDLKTMYGEPLVQIFDWTQVVDGLEPFIYYVNDLSRPDIVTTLPNYVVYQNLNNDPNSNGVDNATSTAYNAGFVNGSNGGTGGFQPWSITITGTAGALIASSAASGFANIDVLADVNGTPTPESFGLFASNGTSRVTANRSFLQNLPVNYEFSVRIATNSRLGNKGINLYNSSGQLLINFSAANNTYRFNNQTLNAAVGAIGEFSSTALWEIKAKQTTATNLEVTLNRLDKTPTVSSVVNVTGVLNRVEFYNEFGDAQPQNRLFFNDLKLQNTYTPSIPSIANYYVDWIGHGTECASIAAGLKCGMAKNARIFALNVTELGAPFGYPFITCLKLVAGFLLGKKNGWYGLNPTTPTILSCSWTIEGPTIVGTAFNSLRNLNTTTGNFDTNIVTNGPVGIPSGKNQPISAMGSIGTNAIGNTDAYNNDALLAASFGSGGVNIHPLMLTSFPNAIAPNLTNSTTQITQNLPSTDDVVDAYMRLFTENGMHVVVCAGNSNIDLNQKTPDLLPVLFFRSAAPSQNFAVLRQMVLNSTTQKYTDNGLGLALNQNYNVGGKTFTLFASGNTYRNYISPDIGVQAVNPDYTRVKYPLIKVGCVSPLGDTDNAVSSYDSGGFTRSIYNLLYSERRPFFMKSNAPGTAGMVDAGGILIKPAGTANWTNVIPTRLCGHWNPFAYSTWGIAVGNGNTLFPNTPIPAGNSGSPDVGFLFNDGVNNTNLSYRVGITGFGGLFLQDPVYVKSPYSNFGPAVDVYAVANATWAGVSNQMLDPVASASAGTPVYYSQTGKLSANDAPPYFKEGLFKNVTSLNNNLTQHGGLYNGKYKFANGTSSACPAVVGCLATFLAQYPRATPLEAKRWLEGSSVKGKILTTVRTPFVSSLSGFNNTGSIPGTFGITFGPDPQWNFNTGTVARVSAVNFGSFGYNHNLWTGINTHPSMILAPTYGITINSVNGQQAMPTWMFAMNGSYENNGPTHLMPTHYYRNTNYFWTSAYFDRYFSTDTGAGFANFNGLQVNNFTQLGPNSLGQGNPATTTTYDVLIPKYFSYIQSFLFQCRFFSDSNNRVVQAHPLRSAVLFVRTGTTYASSIYINQNNQVTYNTRLQIMNPSTELPTLSTTEYRIGNQSGSSNPV